jgi:hypothetical protein
MAFFVLEEVRALAATTINHSDMLCQSTASFESLIFYACAKQADVHRAHVSCRADRDWRRREKTRQFILIPVHVLVINFMAGKQMICGTGAQGSADAEA